jgi:predicted RNA binding protein YcfA (HicA-like mRNA interferase family)
MSSKEVSDLIKEIRRQGFTAEQGKKNPHWVVKKDEQRVTTIASTPSDSRWKANTIAALRRFGFRWPPPKR